MSTVETQNFKDLATSKSIDAAYVTDGTAKAWGFLLSDGTINNSFNISSLTDNGTGDHTVNYSVSFSGGFCTLVCDAEAGNSNQSVDNLTASSSQILVYNLSSSPRDKDTAISVYGDLA